MVWFYIAMVNSRQKNVCILSKPKIIPNIHKLGFVYIAYPWTPKPWKIEGFTPQNMGEIAPKNECFGFPWYWLCCFLVDGILPGSDLGTNRHSTKSQSTLWTQISRGEKNRRNRMRIPNGKNNNLHPQSLTWNLKMMVFNRNLLFQGLIFRFHVSFRGCKLSILVTRTWVINKRTPTHCEWDSKTHLNIFRWRPIYYITLE